MDAYLKGSNPLLEDSILNLFRFLSIYKAWDRPINLFVLSLYMQMNKIYVASPNFFMENLLKNHVMTKLII